MGQHYTNAFYHHRPLANYHRKTYAFDEHWTLKYFSCFHYRSECTLHMHIQCIQILNMIGSIPSEMFAFNKNVSCPFITSNIRLWFDYLKFGIYVTWTDWPLADNNLHKRKHQILKVQLLKTLTEFHALHRFLQWYKKWRQKWTHDQLECMQNLPSLGNNNNNNHHHFWKRYFKYFFWALKDFKEVST